MLPSSGSGLSGRGDQPISAISQRVVPTLNPNGRYPIHDDRDSVFSGMEMHGGTTVLAVRDGAGGV